MRAPIVTFERARRLRRAMTLPEVLLWNELRGRRCAGLRFRRQHPVGPYILDFYCADARLAVEVDGAGHGYEGQALHDARREEWLAGREIRLMRIAAPEILDPERRAAVLNMIVGAAAPSTPLRAVPLPRDAEEFSPW